MVVVTMVASHIEEKKHDEMMKFNKRITETMQNW